MMNIAILIGLMEDILIFAPLINLLTKLGYQCKVIDISEERGWFLKGSQYLVLNYRKPDLSIKFDFNKPERMSKELINFLEDEEIELLLINGKSYSSLLAASSAVNNGFQVVNIDAGLRKYDINDKREILRQLSDAYSTFHLTSLPSATKNLLSEGYSNKTIKLVGHLISDLITQYLGYAKTISTITEELDIDPNKYIVVVINYAENLNKLIEIIETAESEIPLIISINKDVKSRLEEEDKYYKLMMDYDIIFVEPLDFIDHITLLDNAIKVITDTDHIAIEAAILKKYCLYTGGKYPRLELRINWIYDELNIKEFMSIKEDPPKSADSLLGGGLVSENIVDYIKYIKRVNVKHEPRVYIKENNNIISMSLANNSDYWRWIQK